MRVKIGSEWHDSSDKWICVQFERHELEYLKNIMPLDEGNRKLGVGKAYSDDDLLAWVKDEADEKLSGEDQ